MPCSRRPRTSPSLLSLLVPLALAAGAARAQSIDPDCAAGPAVEPRVVLVWPAVPTETALASQSHFQTPLVVSNRVAQTLDYELVGFLQAGGQQRELALASGTLAPLATATLSVPLDGFGVDVSQLAFSAGLRVEARVQSTAGVHLDRAFAPQLFFHRDAGGVVRLYRDAVRRSTFNAGDLHGTVFSAAPPNVIGVFDGGAGSSSPGEETGPRLYLDAHAPGSEWLTGVPRWEFCLRWVYESVDSGFGEDHYASGHLMKARGARVDVDHPNWAGPKSFFASQDNGCFGFVAPENTGFVVTVHAETRLGQGDDVTFRAYRDKPQAIANPSTPPNWVFVASPGGQPRRVYYQNEGHPVSNLIAFGSFVFHWVDRSTTPGLAGPQTLRLINDNPDCPNSDGSCQPTSYVQIEPGKTDRKFLIGHEVGHWIHRRWTGNDLGLYANSYSANSGDADCAFLGVGSHAMRSKEYSVGAFVEGFAHFLSALAWNDHAQTGGAFRYYKDVDEPAYADLEADNWVVDLEGAGAAPSGGVSNWMANMCSVHDGHSVEMDWLRFYWDYRTDAGSKPSHHQVLDHVRYMRDVHPWADTFSAYDRLLDAISDPGLGQVGLLLRFTNRAGTNGVAQ